MFCDRTHRVLLLCGFLLQLELPLLAEDLNCFSDEERANHSLYSQLQQDAYAALDARQKKYDALESAEDVRLYQSRLRELFVERLGGFPARSPLNATTVDTIRDDGYRIEKVIYDSRPNHRITANLYLPEASQPVPGVVVSSGHSRTAKTADYNQRFGITLARHGIAALCFDPIGQGERSQVLNDDGQNRFSGTTEEHLLMGVGSILVGRNTATYRVWDAMRSIDYLVSRPEIDADRIGMTGCSGGGTLTSYTMALDERIRCAAPACYLTTFRSLIEEIGPQDAEQNIFGQLAFGMDQPDYVLMRAPKPTLISSTTLDFFPIRGSWINFRQAKRVYGILGFPERVDLVESYSKHGVTPQNLATIAHWMQRWLLDRDQPIEPIELDVRSPEELLCTESGQVLTSPGEKSVFLVNAEYQVELARRRQRLWKSLEQPDLVRRIQEKIGARVQASTPVPAAEKLERIVRDGYHIDKYILLTEEGIRLPTLVFTPDAERPSRQVYLYIGDEGKSGGSEAGGPIEKLVESGAIVVSVDLRGQGETASGHRINRLGDWKTFFLAYLLERSIVGIRVEDTLAAAAFATQLLPEENSRKDLQLIGVGQSGIVALHTVALKPATFSRLTLRETPRSWASIVAETDPAPYLTTTVHGALELYDLPDLLRLAGPDRVEF